MQKKLLVAGGGIGGLAAAVASARAGWRVELFERVEQFSEIGAGVQLGPNVTRVLQAWGLEGTLAAVAAFPDALVVRSAKTGAEIGRLRLGDAMRTRYGAPYATVHRADLHALLLDAAQVEPLIVLRAGCPVQRVGPGRDSVTVTAGLDVQTEGDALVAADGVWSTVRAQLPGSGAARPTGHVAYRTLAVQAGLPAALRSAQVTAWLGPRLHAITYPVRRGELLNVVLFAEGRLATDVQGWDHDAVSADLQAASDGVCAPLRDLIDAMDGWRLWALYDRPPVAGPHELAKGRVALLGDAAHPMLPYLAQGAGMAIEDADALSQSLAQCPGLDVPHALNRYAELRWRRVARVQARARRNGRIFHLEGPLRQARDLSMRLLGERLLDMPWLYGASR